MTGWLWYLIALGTVALGVGISFHGAEARTIPRNAAATRPRTACIAWRTSGIAPIDRAVFRILFLGTPSPCSR